MAIPTDTRQDNDQPHTPGSSYPTSSEAPRPPDFSDPSAISLLAKDCLERFKKICDVLNNSPPNKASQHEYDRDLALLTMQDASARFRAWGANIGAFHNGLHRASLDFRLKEASGIQDRALKILVYLQEYLHEGESGPSVASPVSEPLTYCSNFDHSWREAQ
jgi:hypothetical protein